MLDELRPDGRLIAAAMRLAAQKPWRDVTLAAIAADAGLGLADLKPHFASKADILAAFMRAADDAVLAKSAAAKPSEPPRDRLFDVVMARFDVLQPWKAALKSIANAGLLEPMLARPFLASQHWMLAAAGIGSEGALGNARLLGLATVYAQTFRTWLADDDPGMARTMAALDRRLRRGEQAIGAIEDTCNGVVRVARDLPAVVRSMFRRTRDKPAETGT